ncbi:MAG: XRE family transcriptional regulator [Bacteroidales bacterium]|jgi:plasmid maintenance system antidote protein VapI|nr:XRE family transcriptional regulator [Bacteroidales bacterium]
MNRVIHIGDIIREELAKDKRSITWLAGKVYHDRSSLCKLLKKPSIDTKLLLDISKAMKFDFFSCYSKLL